MRPRALLSLHEEAPRSLPRGHVQWEAHAPHYLPLLPQEGEERGNPNKAHQQTRRRAEWRRRKRRSTRRKGEGDEEKEEGVTGGEEEEEDAEKEEEVEEWRGGE